MHVIAISQDTDRIDTVRRYLRTRGIDSHVSDELSSAMALSEVLPPMRLQISEHDLPRLHHLLDEDAELRAMIMPEHPVCPRCGSGNLVHDMDPAHNVVELIFSFLARRHEGNTMHCRHCGHEWHLAAHGYVERPDRRGAAGHR